MNNTINLNKKKIGWIIAFIGACILGSSAGGFWWTVFFELFFLGGLFFTIYKQIFYQYRVMVNTYLFFLHKYQIEN